MNLVPTSRPRPTTGYLPIAVVMAGVLLGACATAPPPPTPEPIPEPPPPPPEIVPDTQVSQEMARQAAEIQALKRRITEFELRVLEKEVQLAAVQDKLGDAIQEVVRANAKLQSVESRAEAASTMAEAEAGVRALQAAAGGAEPGPEIAQAEQLLEMSAAEFDDENYGGSLYLTSQVKALIAVAQGRLVGTDLPARAGEMLFAVPLPLRVSRRSNVREGPGTGFRVLFVLPQGTQLVGHAYKDQWMRIRDDQDRVGWIFRTLVDSRPQGNQ